MARVVKQLQIGYGGEPSKFSISIGKRDMPISLKNRAGEPVIVDRVRLKLTPKRDSSGMIIPGQANQKIMLIEKARVFTDDGKHVLRTLKDVGPDDILPKFSHERGLVESACSKALEMK